MTGDPAAPVPDQAVTDAHAAVYAIVDNAMADIAADLGALRGINTKTVRRHMCLAADTALQAAAPAIREAERDRISQLSFDSLTAANVRIVNLEAALREAGAEMDRRYEMGAQAERQRCAAEPAGYEPFIAASGERSVFDIPVITCADAEKLIRARVADLEQLARDILARYRDVTGGAAGRVDSPELREWEIILKGTP